MKTLPNPNQRPMGAMPQAMDASQMRAMAAFQQQQIAAYQQEQQLQMEMYIMQQKMQLESQYQQQLATMQQQFLAQQQQQNHAVHLDDNDVRSMMNKLKPGESFEVELTQGFEVRHSKQTHLNGPQLIVALLLLAVIAGLVFS